MKKIDIDDLFDIYTFTWEEGKYLASAVKGSSTITYTYNENGIRTSKTVNGVKHTYTLNGTQVVSEAWGNKLVLFIYDENGSPIGMQYRESTYAEGEFDCFFYEKNLQGDVMGIFNEAGQRVVWYTYDAFGMNTSNYAAGCAWVRDINPFRYRGYFYDLDTYLYYLNSRYYDCRTGRFISADTSDVLGATPMALTDKNLYAYCDNNPVMRRDDGGEFWHVLAGAAAGAIIGGAVKMASNFIEGKSLTTGLVTAVVAGAASGALASTGIGLAGIIAGNTAISMAENAINQIVENQGFSDFDVVDMLFDGAIGGVAGAIGGAEKGTKNLMNLGKQTVKRTFNATANKGFKAGLKEAGKAFAYYGKNSAKYYKKIPKNLLVDSFSAIGTTIVTSNYMKDQYHRWLGR